MQPTFADLGISKETIAALDRQGLTHPFPIQAETIPQTLKGRDLSGKAPTGSGKTLAFAIPMVERIERCRPKRPRGLVLVPTRELATQITRVIKPLAQAKGLRVAEVYGGVGYNDQLKALRHGCDIVVACPGRLLDLMEREAVLLHEVSFVVLDEADRMADMGFLPAVKDIMYTVPDKAQMLLFSATLDRDINALAKKYQTNPMQFHVETPEEDKGELTHHFWRVHRDNRRDVAVEIAKAADSTVIFCRTQRGVDRLSKQLAQDGVHNEAIHGGRSQNQRTAALDTFARKQVRVLVATDVAARGIHVDDISCVLHYDLPEEHKDFLHRSGRTARAGADGTVIALVLPDQVRAAKQLQRNIGIPVEIKHPNVAGIGFVQIERKIVARPQRTRTQPRRPQSNRNGRFQQRRRRPNQNRRNRSR